MGYLGGDLKPGFFGLPVFRKIRIIQGGTIAGYPGIEVARYWLGIGLSSLLHSGFGEVTAEMELSRIMSAIDGQIA